jgi:hypothetical protein
MPRQEFAVRRMYNKSNNVTARPSPVNVPVAFPAHDERRQVQTDGRCDSTSRRSASLARATSTSTAHARAVRPAGRSERTASSDPTRLQSGGRPRQTGDQRDAGEYGRRPSPDRPSVPAHGSVERKVGQGRVSMKCSLLAALLAAVAGFAAFKLGRDMPVEYNICNAAHEECFVAARFKTMDACQSQNKWASMLCDSNSTPGMMICREERPELNTASGFCSQ